MKLSEVKADLETLDGFEQWLKSKDANSAVGESGSECACPVANYLIEQGYCVEVFNASIDFYEYVNNNPETLATSSLLFNFIGDLDQKYGMNHYPVTASQALEVLRSVKQC